MDPVTGLSLGRIGLGVLALAAPATTAKIFGLQPESNPQLGVVSRMFGAREVALGAVTLASRGTLRRNLTAVGMAVDAADAATGIAGLKTQQLSRSAGLGLAGGALGAVAAGGAALVASRR
jgi:hypothetical protein